MGGASGKTLNTANGSMNPPRTPSAAASNDLVDPRSPSIKRTPLASAHTPHGWRKKVALARHAQLGMVDPRSPGLMRTPVHDHTAEISDPVTPLTLSYGECRKIAADDPRSPFQFRTPLNYTQGLVQYDTSVVACGSFTDDTVIVSDAHTNNDTQDVDVTITASGMINSPLAGMSIVSTSTEIKPSEDILEKHKEQMENPEEEEEEEEQEEETYEAEEKSEHSVLGHSELDIEVPSSPVMPLGASACEKKPSEKAKLPDFASAPSVLAPDRKRKLATGKQQLGVSPLKKSFSSPCFLENDENASPIVVPRRATPTTPRRVAPTTPTSSRRSPAALKRAQTSGRRSSLKNSGGSPRAPLSPITARSQHNSSNTNLSSPTTLVL